MSHYIFPANFRAGGGGAEKDVTPCALETGCANESLKIL